MLDYDNGKPWFELSPQEKERYQQIAKTLLVQFKRLTISYEDEQQQEEYSASNLQILTDEDLNPSFYITGLIVQVAPFLLQGMTQKELNLALFPEFKIRTNPENGRQFLEVTNHEEYVMIPDQDWQEMMKISDDNNEQLK
jgi:hypothetical protein